MPASSPWLRISTASFLQGACGKRFVGLDEASGELELHSPSTQATVEQLLSHTALRCLPPTPQQDQQVEDADCAVTVEVCRARLRRAAV